MYKRFSINDLSQIKSNFISNFYDVIKRENYVSVKDYLNKVFVDGNAVYYMFRGEPTFRLTLEGETVIISDEREKIEIILPLSEKNKMQSLLKDFLVRKGKASEKKSVADMLFEEFGKGSFSSILGKPYIVYDIETTNYVENMKEVKFEIAYSMEVTSDNKMKYEFIDKSNLDYFVNKLINFDGYIVGFNNIYFDNPVTVYNTTKREEDIKILNDKSLDIFYFIREITGKRISLNKVANALIGMQKTLDSGKEGEVLLRKYAETGDEKYMEEFKKYCENDVKLTALVLFYLMHYKRIFIEGQELDYSIEELIEKSKLSAESANKDTKKTQNQSIF